MKKILVSYLFSYRAGNVEGLFITTQEDLERVYDKEIYFGEILGKHSEVSLEFGEPDLKVITDDPAEIAVLEKLFPRGRLAGYNPLDYISDEEEDEDQDV